MRAFSILALIGAANAVCHMEEMGKTCASHPPSKLDDKDPTKICKNPCIDAMMRCSSDATFVAAVGAKAAASMETMKSMCNAGKGHAGDGTCNILEIPAYQDQLKGRKPGCNDAVTKELFDCVDNPLLEKERTKILEMRHDCQPGSSGGRAGDGKCDFLAISKYEKEQKASGKEPDCGSNEVKEEFDCIDDPLMKHRREEIMALRRLCQAGGGKKGDCLSQIQGLGTVMDKGGACCPPGDDCNDPKKHDGKPPKTCSRACAQIWNPFISHCGAALKNLIRHDGDQKDDGAVKVIDEFTTICHGGH